MAFRDTRSRAPSGGRTKEDMVEEVVARARKREGEREHMYREQSLRIHPWICARCGREFTIRNLHLLTVHHKDHNHDNNPADGSNWENLCIYCHENEHRRHLDHVESAGAEAGTESEEQLTHNPFAALKTLVREEDRQ